jgi:hypothetical protein
LSQFAVGALSERCRSSLSLQACPVPSIQAFCGLNDILSEPIRFSEIVSFAPLKMRSVSALIAGIDSKSSAIVARICLPFEEIFVTKYHRRRPVEIGVEFVAGINLELINVSKISLFCSEELCSSITLSI